MSAFLGISVWITLAMVVPGLVTLATVYGAFATSGACSAHFEIAEIKLFGEWTVAGIAVTVMIMTQSIGILVESMLVRKRWLGPSTRQISIPPGVDPLGLEKFYLKPYEEYQGLYLLLAELRDDEDPHGHLQRALAQFFLSNNTLVSFVAGIICTLWQIGASQACDWHGSLLYLALLCACLLITSRVATIRFEVMTKALWAARRRRLEEARIKSATKFTAPSPVEPANVPSKTTKHYWIFRTRMKNKS